MAKREIQKARAETEGDITTPIINLPTGISISLTPQIRDILSREDMSLEEKRRNVLIALGLRSPRRKYKTPEERKKAQRERRAKRRADKLALYEQLGIAPRKRGPKLTPEQKRAKRAERARKKRAGLRELARKNPELAKKFGIDPSRFKL